MVFGPRVVRRRPLLRAAAVGGTFAAGRAMGRSAQQREYAEDMQNQQIQDLQQQQYQQQQQPQQPQQQQQSSVMDQLNQLTALHQQGALNDDEFAAAKAKVLGG